MSIQLSEQEIINIAITTFQNVGIKRYIDKIEVLMEEQIYFQICKIIFPDSENMIQIFKISQSGLPTGKKIQKIIDMISRIIRLDLQHISGQEIAKGNLLHLVNWLELLEALSNNCVSHGEGGKIETEPHEASAIMYTNEDYYTVIGIENQFSKHVYTDENNHTSSSEDTSIDPYLEPIQKKSIEGNEEKRKKKKEKKVTFAEQSKKGKAQKNSSLRTTTTQATTKIKNNSLYPQPTNIPKQMKFLKKKQGYINKMHYIQEEIQKKQINDQNIEFEQWAYQKNRKAIQSTRKIQQEDKQRKQYVKQHISRRQEVVDSLLGEKEAVKTMKRMFKQQKKAQKKMSEYYRKQYEEEAKQLMDINFASAYYNQLQRFLSQQ